MRRFTPVLVAIILLLLGPAALPVQAALITVDDSCSLRDALVTADSETPLRGCAAGNGHDTIRLTGDVTLDDNPVTITSQITIEGNGYSISGDKQFRIFMVAASGDLTIQNATLRDGQAAEGGVRCLADGENSAGYGGAICNHGRLRIFSSRLTGNSAEVGGAIYNDGVMSIRNASFTGNSVDWGGGAISNAGTADLSISGSSFTGNSAVAGGGAMINWSDASLSISGSSFIDNSARVFGGAISNSGEAAFTNSSFSGNSAVLGGAIQSWGAAILSHLTIVNNSADIGGGIFVREDSEGTYLRNSILADNTGGDCVNEIELEESLNNLIKDDYCLGATGLSGDPGLSDWVEPEDGSPRYFPLPADSIAIDAAADSACADTDQIGTPRPQGGGCDIGAIEFVGDSGGSDATGETTPGIIPLGPDCSLRNAIIAASLKTPVRGCVAGDGTNTIHLTADVSLDDDPLTIDSQITIEGNGYSISGDKQFRIFMIAEPGDLTIQNLTLRDGRTADGDVRCLPDNPYTDDDGGAICNHGRLSIINSRFTGNSADDGGAIANWGEAIISDSRFSGNSARYGGAIANGGDARLIISGSSFSDNAVEVFGGAIMNFLESYARISNSSFTNNLADGLGGAMTNMGEAILSHLTIVNNSALAGGGIYEFDDSDGMRLRNSILADNTGGDCVNDIELSESLNNIIEDGSCLDEIGLSGDPGLGSWVEPADGSPGYFPLLADSPAIDVGADSACAEADQLGTSRPQGAGCDIGAIEFVGSSSAD